MRKRESRLTDIVDQCQVIELAGYGFSARYIAFRVMGVPVNSDSYCAQKTRQAIHQFLYSQGIRLRDWRDGESRKAVGYANQAVTLGINRGKRQAKAG